MPRPYLNGYPGEFLSGSDITIASSAQESSQLDTGGLTLCGIFLPAAFTGTALTFEGCPDSGGTFVAVKSTTSGTTLSYTVAQGTYCALDPKDFQGLRFIKIKSGSSEGASRTLTCSLRGF